MSRDRHLPLAVRAAAALAAALNIAISALIGDEYVKYTPPWWQSESFAYLTVLGTFLLSILGGACARMGRRANDIR